jgi:hypothetical protein
MRLPRVYSCFRHVTATTGLDAWRQSIVAGQRILRGGECGYRVQVALSASHSESIVALACFGSRG